MRKFFRLIQMFSDLKFIRFLNSLALSGFIISAALSVFIATPALAAQPSTNEISKHLVISMGNDSDVGRAFQMSNTEIGSDRKVLSTSDDPFGPPTDGGFPNLLDVFETRWNLATDPDSINGAATVFQGVDWSGDSALTSNNGKFDFSNSLVFARTGIQGTIANPLEGASNTFYYPYPLLTRSLLALNNGTTGNNDFSQLLLEISAWKTYIESLSNDLSITSNTLFSDNMSSNGAGGLRSNYLDTDDTNNDGVIVIDVVLSSWELNNLDWVIEGSGNKLIIFRLKDGCNMKMSNVSILLGTGGIANNGIGVIFYSGYEGDSSDTVFDGV